MLKTTTDCCALCQLSRVNNNTSIKDIRTAIRTLRKEKYENVEVGVSRGKGQTAVFTVVSPGEDRLAKNLMKVGFKRAHTFERRQGYPPGLLGLYIKNL